MKLEDIKMQKPFVDVLDSFVYTIFIKLCSFMEKVVYKTKRGKYINESLKSLFDD